MSVRCGSLVFYSDWPSPTASSPSWSCLHATRSSTRWDGLMARASATDRGPYTDQGPVYSVQCPGSRHWPGSSVQCPVSRVQTLTRVQCTVSSVQCPVSSVQQSLSRVQTLWPVSSAQSLTSVQCPVTIQSLTSVYRVTHSHYIYLLNYI